MRLKRNLLKAVKSEEIKKRVGGEGTTGGGSAGKVKGAVPGNEGLVNRIHYWCGGGRKKVEVNEPLVRYKPEREVGVRRGRDRRKNNIIGGTISQKTSSGVVIGKTKKKGDGSEVRRNGRG